MEVTEAAQLVTALSRETIQRRGHRPGAVAQLAIGRKELARVYIPGDVEHLRHTAQPIPDGVVERTPDAFGNTPTSHIIVLGYRGRRPIRRNLLQVTDVDRRYRRAWRINGLLP